MERQRDKNGDRSDDEDHKYRRRDGDKFRSERDSQDRRINKSDEEDINGRRGRDRNRDRRIDDEVVIDRRDRNRKRSDDEDANDRRRDRHGDKRNAAGYADDRRRNMNRDDTRSRDRNRDGRSDDENANDKWRKDRNKDKEIDAEDDNARRRGRSRDLRGDEEDGNDRRNKQMDEDRRKRGKNKDIRSDEEDGNDRSNRKKSEDRKRSDEHDQSGEEVGEIRKAGKKHEERSDEEDGEIRKRGRKGKHEGRSDNEDGEIRKRGRKGKHEDMSDDEDGEIRKRGRKGKHEGRSDEEDGEIRKRGRKGRDRRSDDEDDSKDRRRRDRNKDAKVDEGPRFQKLAEMQESMTNLGKSGGVYIPPFKLARMMNEVQDKSSMEYQRMTWDALRKSINGLVNKVNATNIKNIIPELFAENLIRGRGLFCRSCMKSQMASPGFTDVFAALVAVVNTKFPEVGDLLLRRIILQLQRAYKRNDKPQLLAAVKFIAHLVNQQIVHELIALELLTTLLENPTDDSVEVAVGFVTECGSILQDLSPRGLHGIFERFRGILHEGEIDKRVQFLIEGLFALRKAKFQGHPAVRPELDLVELEDQLTHEVSLLDKIDPEISLDIFKLDPSFIENEKRYEDLKKTILGDESEEEEEGGEDSDDEEDESSEEEDEEQMRIRDETETNLVNLRRTIYLTIMSSVDFEEAGHKLLKIKLEPGQEMELCIMLLECCSQERTYLRYYGLLGQRFCMINKVYQENFEKCFVQQYSMIHRLETNKLRNVAKFFAHLLGTDALPWHVLAYIRLTEEDTTSSSRIFIKILFQELSEHLGIGLLNERLSEPTMQADFESIFPRDNPKNTRFSINFFTSIGLGGITENLREYLKNMPRLIMQQKPASESDDSDSSSSGSGSSSSDESSDSDSDSESDHKRSKRRKRR
ncbi:pre-mRNA-splicing factor CWC22 homolog [Cynara cardunculus var. scolymus]|uniref:pre-mRNA-splicing factor CWC22 homolog n=1 Tax=Cynara cardunculus var. scolymus TaxID=59895 RepID=UPI000D624455|nr:pre-mRNA-splicing factor CWC22 homolog [Cynara cardunculus var. scolymus]